MGQDIHAFIEVEYDNDHIDGGMYVRSWGKVDLRRNYWLFGLMAGSGRAEVAPLVPARGIPERLGSQAQLDPFPYWLIVNDDIADHGFCSSHSAAKYVAMHHTEKEVNGQRWVRHPDAHTASYLYTDELDAAYCQWQLDAQREHDVERPAHQAIYDELLQTIGDDAQLRTNLDRMYADLLAPRVRRLFDVEATIAAMRALNDGRGRPRLTFWFDN